MKGKLKNYVKIKSRIYTSGNRFFGKKLLPILSKTIFMAVRMRIFLFLSIISISFSVSAQQRWPNTFLWRISGNGLTKPSYLYGTIHLQEKKLFYFGDSLYAALENTEGFATEVNFNEYLDSIFNAGKGDEIKQEGPFFRFNRKNIDRSTDSLLKKVGVRGDSISRGQLKKIRDYRRNKLVQGGEMPTIMDAYLQGLAQRLHKWTGGIEDVTDQESDMLDETGSDLTPENVLMSEKKVHALLDSMIALYLKQDLEQLNRQGNSEAGIDAEIMLKRNRKMASRMDSLSQIRTMLFAVGVAHLPGDSGVIQLLRQKGFSVDPVYASTKTDPDIYAAKLPKREWVEMMDPDFQFSVRMPGAPSAYPEKIPGFTMKMFFDMSTMTFYMAGQGMGRIETKEQWDKMIQNMAANAGVLPKDINRKMIKKGNLNALDGSYTNEEGGYRFQVIQHEGHFFMLMVGVLKKANLQQPGIDSFFSSFSLRKNMEEKSWVKFSVPEKAFSIMFPGTPAIDTSLPADSLSRFWHISSYTLTDIQKGIYYFLQVRDVAGGYFLDSDSIYFEENKNELKNRFDSLTNIHVSTYLGFPSMNIDVYLKSAHAAYRLMYVIRGNRIYVLLAGADQNADLSEANRFFESLQLEEYKPLEWQTYTSEGFSAMAPAPFEKMPADSSAGDTKTKTHFNTTNLNEAVSYEVIKEVLPPYYWVANDSTYYKNSYLSEVRMGDSVLTKKNTVNGALNGMEMHIRVASSNNIKKIRLFVNGDTLYSLACYLPAQYIERPEHNRFFETFRVQNEKAPLIYTNKAKKLFEALLSTDSTEFTSALTTLDVVEFSKEDLPVLHEALTKKYLPVAGFEDSPVPERIVKILQTLGDSSTVEYIKRHYGEMEGEREPMKYTLLEVLSNIKTSASYGVLKDKLLTDLPHEGDPSSLEYTLQDSSELTRTLFPEILQLVRDSVFAQSLVSIALPLVDSGALHVSDLMPYRQAFLSLGKKNLQLMKKDSDKVWEYSDWIPFIGKFNDRESNAMLREYLKLSELEIKHLALITLIKNNQPVPPSDIEKVAAGLFLRNQLYEELTEMKKTQLFPLKYRNQKSLAEGQLFAIAADEVDDADCNLVFIGERIAMYRGKKNKFYLFKVNLIFEDSSESYLGIAGPYEVVPKTLVNYGENTNMVWNEEYSTSKTEKQFRTFLKDHENYYREKDMPAESLNILKK